MINPKELRIGNLVNISNTNPIIIGKVNAIECDRIRLLALPNYLSWLTCQNIDPIPLTDEWLLRFFFVKKEHQTETKVFQSSKLYFSAKNIITYVNGKIEVLDYHNIRNKSHIFIIKTGFFEAYIDFVHQLQNLYFTLTGKDFRF